MEAHLSSRDRLLLWATLPLMAVVLAAHVYETARTGLAQLPVLAEWVPGDYPRVAGYRLETDSSGSGLLPGDRLIRVGDRDLRGVGYIGFHAIGLARTRPGHPVPLVFERGGERRTVPLEARPHPQRWSRLPILLLIPVICVLILVRAPGQRDVQRFYLCFMTYAIGQAQFYGGPEWKSWVAAGVWNVASPLMIFFMLRFARLFPPEIPEERRVPAALPWVAVGLFIVFVRLNYVLAWPLPIAWVPRVSFASHGVMTVLGIAIFTWNYVHAWPAGRRRLRWILLGTGLGSLPVIAASVAPLLLPGWEGFRQAFAVGFVSSVIWMMGAVLGTVRDNAFDVDRLIGATAAWSLAAAGAVAGLAVAVPTLSSALSESLGIDPTTSRLALAAVLGALLVPVAMGLRPHVDRILFPGRARLQEGGQRLVEELARCETPEALLHRAAGRSAALFEVQGWALYRRSGAGLLLDRCQGLEPPAQLEDPDSLPRRAKPRNAPPALGASVALVVPIRLKDRTEALLALGPKRSGDIFTNDDTAVLNGIADRVETEWVYFQKQAADRENREKTNLLATASHDLRQPLHAVSLLTEALHERLDDPEVRDLVGRIGESTHDLDEMLTSLLDRTRLDAGGVRPEIAGVSLAPLFASLERDFAAPARERGIRLRVVPTQLAVRTDRLLMARILRNLVSNALRYAGEEGRVMVAARRRGRRVEVEVRDSGPGVPEASQREIFQAFHQLAGAEPGGLGLGLSIVDGLARVLGHEVTLRSAPGYGSTFSIAAEAAPPDPARPAALAPKVSASPFRQRVLVVDDDRPVREATVAMLQSWGCEARAAADLEGAREALAGDWCPDWVLADYDLGPGCDGLGVLEALGDLLGPDLRAAVLTADATAPVAQRLAASGLPVLRKPLKPARLRALLGGGASSRAPTQALVPQDEGP